MNRLIIFCESYGNQIELTLQLARDNYQNRKVMIIVTGFDDLYKFLHEINIRCFASQLELIYIKPFSLSHVSGRLNRLLNLLPDMISERKYTKEIWNKYFQDLRNSDVYFQSRGYSGIKHYLIKKISQNNRIIYVPPLFPPEMVHYFPVRFTDLGKLLIYKLVFGFDIALGQFYSTKGFPWMSDRYLKKVTHQTLNNKDRNKLMGDFSYETYKVFDEGKYKVIYFDDNTIGAGYLKDFETFKNEFSKLLSIVRKYYPESSVACKYHPGYSGDFDLLGIRSIIPSYIPAELLHNVTTDLYISVFSRSITNLPLGKAISIADLISFKDENIKERFREDTLRASHTKILFPKTMAEFENILSGTNN